MITQDAKIKDERYLSLNINVNLADFPELGGSDEPMH